MKALFITRPTVFSGPGGDTIQLLKTKEYLEYINVSVDIYDGGGVDFNNYDVIHFFNLRNPQDIYSYVKKAKNKNIPIVLSTIWGSYYECDQKARTGFQKWVANKFPENIVEYLKTSMRIIKNRNIHSGTIPYLLKGHYRSQYEIVKNTDVLLPNSPTELKRVKLDLNQPNKQGLSVANAVDLRVFDYDSVIVDKYKRYKGCLLSAARIEIRKCQLDLIMAMKDLPYKLVVVGKPSPNSMDYYNQCRDLAGDNVDFIEHVSQDELAELYKVCKAHALISWMETPGLSSLEAAVMKSNILVTNRGDTEYYFEDYATYCEPGDVASIRKGIIAVMEKEYSPDLRDRVLSNFTWEHTASQTLDGYKLAIKQHNK
ncbi:glycosyltransferase family 4 protein [Photobacterium damselae]|uniref:glycosyltransferase family 4 protein n=1 Tax=Photobacterium damselae TaxID=38293 RepID=UPI001EDE1F30|nr:glycosyltransferase family 4 protein [Photobacterium damselae]MCG3817836.1 glycosyltransferase family 4 protein [Photobacterium damselae]